MVRRVISRSQWDTPIIPGHDSRHISSSQEHQTPLSPSTPHPMKHDAVTPIDPLGIRLWPAALQRPQSENTTNCSQNMQDGAYMMIFPTNYLPEHSVWNSSCYQINDEYQFPPSEKNMVQERPSFDPVGNSLIEQKFSNEQFDSTNLHAGLDTFENSLMSKEVETPAMDTRTIPTSLGEPLHIGHGHRRFSTSSFISNCHSPAAITDVPDMSGQSEGLSYLSDYTPRSTLNTSATPLSQVHSPRYNTHEIGRAGSRPRASPSPRPSMRAAPYSFEGARSKSWSTGSHAPFPSRRTTPIIYNPPDDYFSPVPAPLQMNSPTMTTNNGFQATSTYDNFNNLDVLCGPPRFHRQARLLPSTMAAPERFNNSSQPPQSQFSCLQSNGCPSMHETDSYHGFSEPPDLYSSLRREHLAPPEKDMQPSDVSLTPTEQQIRFDDDLYTPRYVRGQGQDREGWCGICRPGRWLVLKTSAYWYDKSFTHGVSAASGQAFDAPKEKRTVEGSPDLWEGLCGKCGEWIALVSSKKKGTTWFRHAYRCHTHQKVKDVPKRRRGNKRKSRANKVTTPPEPRIRAVTPATETTERITDGTPTSHGSSSEH